MEIDTTTVLAAVQAIVIAYIVYKQTIGKAKVDNRPDELRAYAELQVELGRAAENLVEPLNKRIADQQEQLTRQSIEMDHLRDVIRIQSDQIAELTKRVNEVEGKNRELEADLAVSVENEERLSDKLNKVRKEIDTGPLTNKRNNRGNSRGKS